VAADAGRPRCLFSVAVGPARLQMYVSRGLRGTSCPGGKKNQKVGWVALPRVAPPSRCNPGLCDGIPLGFSETGPSSGDHNTACLRVSVGETSYSSALSTPAEQDRAPQTTDYYGRTPSMVQERGLFDSNRRLLSRISFGVSLSSLAGLIRLSGREPTVENGGLFPFVPDGTGTGSGGRRFE
jgi:hypothetical protein